MTPEQIRNQCEDDADRAPCDLTVWRDRGAIIAAQQARIAQLERDRLDVSEAMAGALDDAADAIVRATDAQLGHYDGDHAETARLAIQGCVDHLRVRAAVLRSA